MIQRCGEESVSLNSELLHESIIVLDKYYSWENN